MCDVETVSKIAKCLQVPLGKVQLNEEQVGLPNNEMSFTHLFSYTIYIN